MGISRLVVGKILNHVETGVTAIYDRHSYDQEKRQALEAWGAWKSWSSRFTTRRAPAAGPAGAIEVRGARGNNLKGIDGRFPLGLFTCVSGAGESTLVNQILYPALARRLHDGDEEVGAHDALVGLEHLDKVINIDQKPIGRTPRSNP